MSRRGPKPKLPTKEKTGPRPYPPKDLDSVAKRAWDSLCDDLESRGNLLKSDRKLLELYARTYSLWSRTLDTLASQELATPDVVTTTECNGVTLTTTSPPDRRFLNPLANLSITLSGRLRQILLDCGLSPSTRKGDSSDADSPWTDILDGTPI